MRSVLILLAVLNGLALNAYAQSSLSVLSDLPATAREDIARLCLPLQYRDGADAYRNCVKEEVATRNERRNTDTLMDAINRLSFDDQYAIQQACGTATAQTENRACINQQLTALNALATPTLSELSADEQYVMQQNCFQAQTNLGAAAYRQCQLDAIASVANMPVPNYFNLSAIDRNTLQLDCSNTQPSLRVYRACLNVGTTQAGQQPAQPLDRQADQQISQPLDAPLDTATQLLQPENLTEQNDLQTSSVNTAARIVPTPTELAPTSELPAPTTVRIASEPDLAAAKPANGPTLGTASATDQQLSVQALNSGQTGSVISTSVGVANNAEAQSQSGAAAGAAASAVANAAAGAAPNADADADINAQTQVQADAQGNDQANDQADSGSSSQGASDNAEILAQLQAQFETLKTSAIDWFTNLSDQGKMLLAALVVMPIALLILLAGRARRDEDSDEEFEYARQDLKRQVRSSNVSPNALDAREQDDPMAASWAAEADSLFDEAPMLADETLVLERPAERHAEPSAGAGAAASTHATATAAAPAQSQPAKRSVAAASASATRPSSGFAGWLDSQPDALRLTLAIEFLLYWMAYGDDRYEPALKQKIFQTPDPSSHDIVKRWVLKQDVHAFADTVGWLQTHTTAVQKEQIVRFLMAMLVNGTTPSPLQNTLLRFLGDVFFLDAPSVEEMFLHEFATELPPVPRVDRVAWWDRQPSGVATLWDARALKDSDPISQHAAQLGVDGRAGVEHIQAAYRQAMQRCEASRYDQLGEREHRLISSRHARLTQAKDELLEALA